jgi:hypothetical protein
MLHGCILCLPVDVRYEELQLTHVIISLNPSLGLLFYLDFLYRTVHSVLITKLNTILEEKLNLKNANYLKDTDM